VITELIAIRSSQRRYAQAFAARRGQLLIGLGALSICAAAGLVSLLLGPDDNWDLRYYHLYGVWAYLHDRYLFDIAPAQFQGFFNPVADLLFYGLISSSLNETPRVIAFIMGAIHGLNAVLVAAIAAHVVRPHVAWQRATLRVIAVLIGVTGAGFVSLIGCTTNDLINSIFVLAALLGLLDAAASPQAYPPWRGFAWSGLSAGVAVGLKYTAAIFAPGLVLVAIVAAARHRSARALIAFAATAIVGFATVAGHHLITLWHEFGNPVFPLFNNVFQSPYFDSVPLRDVQFVPRNLWQLIGYPFYWTETTTGLVSEPALRDWRGAIAYVAVLSAALACIVRWWRQDRRNTRDNDPVAELHGFDLLLGFVVISYFVWALGFGNYRYGVPLEMLSGVVIVGAVILTGRIFRSAVTIFERAARGWVRVAAGAAALLLAAATTVYPDWGRGQFADRYIDVRMPPLPAESVVLIASWDPASYFIPFAEPSAHYVGVENNFLSLAQSNLLADGVKELMRAPGRAKFMVNVGAFDPDYMNRTLHQFGLKLGTAPCQPIRSNLENRVLERDLPLSLCPAVPE
jgi:glycosyl transferase family 87